MMTLKTRSDDFKVYFFIFYFENPCDLRNDFSWWPNDVEEVRVNYLFPIEPPSVRSPSLDMK